MVWFSTDLSSVPVLLIIATLFSRVGLIDATCHTSIYGIYLEGHVLKELPNMDIHNCYQRCKTEVQCQSLNVFMSNTSCYLNNRTIGQKPDSAVKNRDAVYFENPKRILIGSVRSLPALSCLEIRRGSSTAVSGVYWLLNETLVEKYCNMDTGMVEECTGSPCQNKGTCHYKGRGTYTCSCATGFTGVHCETNIDDCVGSTCSNGGTCIDGVNSYTCNCVPGYAGPTCLTNIDECVGSTCSNGGTCIDGVNSYTCNCVPGYAGPTCLTNINECSSSPCLNGGTCVDGVNRYTCTCRSGWTSTRCQTAAPTPECSSYTTISGANRHRNYGAIAVKCDRDVITTRWYRITGSAGSILASSCVPTNRCDTHATGWLNGNLPSYTGDIVTRQVCFHWSGKCCNWSVNVRIRHCGSYYVYELRPAPSCQLRYCTQ